MIQLAKPVEEMTLEEFRAALSDVLQILGRIEAAGHRAHDLLAAFRPESMEDPTFLVRVGMVRESLRSVLDLPLDEVRQIVEAGART